MAQKQSVFTDTSCRSSRSHFYVAGCSSAAERPKLLNWKTWWRLERHLWATCANASTLRTIRLLAMYLIEEPFTLARFLQKLLPKKHLRTEAFCAACMSPPPLQTKAAFSLKRVAPPTLHRADRCFVKLWRFLCAKYNTQPATVAVKLDSHHSSSGHTYAI